MRCYTCARLSWSIFCKACTTTLFTHTMQTRKVASLDVISFYQYTSIESLLLTKYKAEGYRIYKALGKITMKPFVEEFLESYEGDIYIIGVDEVIKKGYAHIAVLSRTMQSKRSIPLYASLIARNKISYAGKDLVFRLENPRDFVYKGKENIDAILIDDIITTGLTLGEAHKVLRENGVNVLFALTLADVLEG